MSAVHLQDVSFSYKQNAPLLRIEDLLIDEGERVLLYGPSGSGKTTLLGLVAGTLRAHTGDVQVLGKDMSRLSPSARDRHRGTEMGYILQRFNLIPYLSIRENIALPCHVHAKRMKRITASTLDGEIARIAEQLGLDGFLHEPVTRLTTSQQQRVVIARAVIGAPRLVIADELTSSLDRDHQESFLRLLVDVCDDSRSTLIFVSHDNSLMSRFERQVALVEINRVISC